MADEPLNIRGVNATINTTFDVDDLLNLEVVSTRAESDEQALDLNSFLEILNAIIRFEEMKENKTQYPVKIVEDFPDSDLYAEVFGTAEGDPALNELGSRFGELIQYTLIRRRPGSIQQTAHPMAPGNMREYAPRFRGEYPDPNYPGYTIRVNGQYMDNLIQLTVWAKSTESASNRALWLENLIERYRYYFLKKGFNKIRFEGRSSDRVYTSASSTIRIVGRPLTFYLRTEKIILVREKDLEDIEISLSLAK